MMNNIKTIKCAHCNTRVDNDDDQIDLAIATCPRTKDNCGIAQNVAHLNEFTRRLKDKAKGIPRLLFPLPPQNTAGYPARSHEDLVAEQQRNYPELYRDSLERMDVVDAINKESKATVLEFEVDDIVAIIVDKKGNVKTTTLRE